MFGVKTGLAILALVGGAHGAAMADSAAPALCDTREAVFYFSPGADDLDTFGAEVAARFAEKAKACPVAKIEIIGHADANGDAAANQKLSVARAEAASEALIDAGLTQATFDLQGAGEREAVSAAGEQRPMARRAVVRLVLAPSDADVG